MSYGVVQQGQEALQELEPGMRYKVRFESAEVLEDALIEEVTPLVRVINRRRCFIGIGNPHEQRLDLSTHMGLRHVHDLGGTIEVDRQYFPEVALVPEPGEPSAATEGATLDEVLQAIGLSPDREGLAGSGVILALVDTGINGQRPEFIHRGEGWAPIGEDPWTDPVGHGTMVACIAAGSRSAGGACEGIAPEALIYPCRTTYVDTELTTLYDRLVDVANEDDMPLVICNSWGFRTSEPPELSPQDDFPNALQEATDAGLVVVFSAGNNHRLVGGVDGECEPSSIWAFKCRESVLTVGAVDLQGRPWWYSSRGPGQHHAEPGSSPKPDLCGAVPAGGEIVYGDRLLRLAHWGTSGAAPQAAGLAALMLEAQPRDPVDLFETMRATARPGGFAENCVGAGIIDCRAALGFDDG